MARCCVGAVAVRTLAQLEADEGAVHDGVPHDGAGAGLGSWPG